ncbi:hypothetical protein [Companilactobacillus kedongensis]|uniref:hypothetical protein n=1 Tax=Companilactobacillus kedongensis TaxID=2486004 RepID=UPI000F7A6290|nr:hypothetical protein [Companilactobacillus kedongensis]
MQIKKIVKGFIFAFVAIMAFFGILQRTSNVVEAASYFDSQVIGDPPPGGLPISNYFKTGDYTGNSARVVKGSTDTVQVTSEAGQTGAVWSDNQKNYLNISKKQTISMWMYFGTVNSLVGIPDGLAFVLQNGPISAISNTNGTVNSGESLGVWGSDSNRYAVLGGDAVDGVTPVEKQAIQNSFAIEFDTETNHYKGKSPMNYYDYISNGKSSADLPDPKNAMDFLPYDIDDHEGPNYNYLYSTSNDKQYAHIAWNYPARATSYVQLSNDPPKMNPALTIFGSPYPSGTSIIALKHHLGAGGNGANVYLQRETGNNVKPRASWRHVTIEYIPAPSGSNNATLTYKVGDKNPETGDAKSPQVDVTLSLDMSAFGNMNGSDKLRYGFTGSTGANADTNSAVVFETMPSLVDAEANAYVVDKTANTRLEHVDKDSSGNNIPAQANQNYDLIDDDSLALTPTKKVHPKDDLTLNYRFHYLSGEEPATGLKSTFNIPTNVTVNTDSSGNIGTMHYVSKADSDEKTTKKDVPIPASALSTSTDSSGSSKQVVSADLDTMGDSSGDDWEYARAELNASAADTDTKLNVPLTTSTIKGDNYNVDIDSSAFDIIPPAAKMNITTDMADPTEVKLGDKFNLTGAIKFDPESTVNKSDMYISYTIGDKTYRAQDDSAGDKFTIQDLETGTGAGQLDVGDHTIKVQVIDNNFKAPDGTTDTISSNVLEYHIKVTNKTVVITPDKSNITVNDNEPLILSGTYLHSDNTTTADEGGLSTITYTITNPDGTKQDEVKTTEDNNGKYAFTLKPYAYDKDPSQSLDDYTGNTGLKVGKNVVTINITDQSGHKSDAKEVTVNVPDITPTLSTDQDEYSVIEDDPINMNAKVGYDGDYQVTPSKLTWTINANNHSDIKSYTGDTPTATPISQDFTVDSTASEMNDQDKNPYPVSVSFTDPYGRKSKTLKYNVNIINKTATIDNSNYTFQPVHQSDNPRRVKRNGPWNLKVDSVRTPWTLTARAGDMYKQVSGSDPIKLDGDLVYVSKDGATHDLSTQTVLQSKDIPTDSGSAVSTDIAGGWTPDDGVLLDLKSRNVSGTYTGTVEWGLTDGI